MISPKQQALVYRLADAGTNLVAKLRSSGREEHAVEVERELREAIEAIAAGRTVARPLRILAILDAEESADTYSRLSQE